MRKRGFTLIEILLALTIFSTLSLTVYLVFSQGLRVEKRLREASRVDEGVFAVVQTCVKDLEQIEAYTLPESQKTYFQGSPHEIRFLISQDSDLYEIHYALSEIDVSRVRRVEVNGVRQKGESFSISREDESTSVQVLVRSNRIFLKHKTGLEFSKNILSQRVAYDGLTFSYLKREESGDTQWVSEWDQKGLPLSVRIDLTLINSEGQKDRVIRDVFIGAQGKGALGD